MQFRVSTGADAGAGALSYLMVFYGIKCRQHAPLCIKGFGTTECPN